VPTYQYVCTECGEQIEVVQKFTDDPLTVHEADGGRLRKVFSPVGIVFKGSGFYRTDSRKGAVTSSSGSSSGEGSSSDSSPGNGEKKSEKSEKSEKSDKSEKTAATSSGDKSSSSSSGSSSAKSSGSSGEKVA
jgi:putative FmdB family regulatory protein